MLPVAALACGACCAALIVLVSALSLHMWLAPARRVAAAAAAAAAARSPPHIFWQIALGGEGFFSAANASAARAAFERRNPGWRYRLVRDDDARAFLRLFFAEHIEPFNALARVPQWQADLLRYLLLFEHGGIYADLDLDLLLPLDELLGRCAMGAPALFVRGGRRPKDEAANGLIASAPRNPLMLALAARMQSTAGSPDFAENVRSLWAVLREAEPAAAGGPAGGASAGAGGSGPAPFARNAFRGAEQGGFFDFVLLEERRRRAGRGFEIMCSNGEVAVLSNEK